MPLILLPKGIRAAVEADSSAERPCAFLLTPESGLLSLQLSNSAHAPHQSPKGAGTKFTCCTGTKVQILTRRTALIEDAEEGGAGNAGKESRPASAPTPPQSVTAPSPPQSGGGGIDVQKSGLDVGATSAKTGGGLDGSAKSGGGLCDASGKSLSRAEAKCEQRGRIEMVKASFAYGKGT